jgi:ATP-dependent exoDNAse (exonuclease V) beta subunit
MNLSAEQQAAVERAGQDVCVVAGPGAGKTRVLTERFFWLVENRAVSPTRILAVTFTEKAAAEIKERLVHRFATRPDLRDSIERAWIDTIDGFCARFLREHAIAAGISPDFAVLDAPPAARLLRGATEQALDELFTSRPDDMRRLMLSIDLSTSDTGPKPDLADALIEVYETMRISSVAGQGARRGPGGPPHIEPFTAALDRIRPLLSPVKESHTRLREWMNRFLALPAKVSLDHFRTLADLKINLTELGRGSVADLARQLRDELKPRLEAEWIAHWYAGLDDLLRLALDRMAAIYSESKRRESALDFGDLEELTVRLLEADSDLRAKTAGRFDEILMDELQDTNPLQWRLVELIRRRFFGVGDLNQSIYGFRHAEPRLFQEYRARVAAGGGHVDDLRDNYRSRPEILRAVERVLADSNGIEPRALHAANEFAPAFEPIVMRLAATGDTAPDVEAAAVAARIRELTDSGAYLYQNIAVLVRSLRSLDPFFRAFDRFSIPFLVSGGRTFYEAREIRDLMNLLAALVNPLDEIALVGVLRSPFGWYSDQDIFHLAKEGCRAEFDRLYGDLRKQAGSVAPDRLLAEAVDRSGYALQLPERARANLEKLYGWLRREHRQRLRPLAEILEDLEAQRAGQAEAEAPPPEAGDVVRMMSVHQAKGLEFKLVFLSALQNRGDRSKPIVVFSPEHGLGVKWRHPATGKGVSDAAHLAFMADRKQREEAEENRLLYVAMTRAEDRLFLTYTKGKQRSSWLERFETAISDAITFDAAPVPPPAHSEAVSSSVQRLDRPVITGQHPYLVSVTGVGSAFQAAPAFPGGLSSLDLGTAVHRILAGENLDDPEARELADLFHASDLGQRAARATRLEREFDFLLPIEDTILSGQIDLWFEEAGELVLVDYKTGRDDWSAQYELQLKLYALALERYAGRRPDRAVVCYLRSNTTIEIDVSNAESAREAVRAHLDSHAL